MIGYTPVKMRVIVVIYLSKCVMVVLRFSELHFYVCYAFSLQTAASCQHVFGT